MPTIHSFGPFRLDPDAEILFRGAEPIALGRRAVSLLRVLVERPGMPVSKHALIEAAWSGLAVLSVRRGCPRGLIPRIWPTSFANFKAIAAMRSDITMVISRGSWESQCWPILAFRALMKTTPNAL